MTNLPSICVTGANGFIASHIVKQLLASGKYIVHGTVRDPKSPAAVKHLWELPNADTNLKIFAADLMVEGSFDAAITGCQAVLHTASPVFAQTTEQDTFIPATFGTQNVLKSAGVHQDTVKRVVLTSSVCTIFCDYGSRPASHIYTEADWSDLELMREKEDWYCLSKTVAELEAHEIAKQYSWDLRTILPGLTVGELLAPKINASVRAFANYIQGSTERIKRTSRWLVDVQDVAAAHILVMEQHEGNDCCYSSSSSQDTNSSSSNDNNRYIVCNDVIEDQDACKAMLDAEPSLPVPTEVDDHVDSNRTFSNAKIKALGLEFSPFNETASRFVKSMQKFNLV